MRAQWFVVCAMAFAGSGSCAVLTTMEEVRSLSKQLTSTEKEAQVKKVELSAKQQRTHMHLEKIARRQQMRETLQKKRESLAADRKDRKLRMAAIKSDRSKRRTSPAEDNDIAAESEMSEHDRALAELKEVHAMWRASIKVRNEERAKALKTTVGEMFTSHDLDDNKVLDPSETRQMIDDAMQATSGKDGSEDTKIDDEDFDAVFHELDANKDGVIEKEELDVVAEDLETKANIEEQEESETRTIEKETSKAKTMGSFQYVPAADELAKARAAVLKAVERNMDEATSAAARDIIMNAEGSVAEPATVIEPPSLPEAEDLVQEEEDAEKQESEAREAMMKAVEEAQPQIQNSKQKEQEMLKEIILKESEAKAVWRTVENAKGPAAEQARKIAEQMGLSEPTPSTTEYLDEKEEHPSAVAEMDAFREKEEHASAVAEMKAIRDEWRERVQHSHSDMASAADGADEAGADEMANFVS